MTCIEDLDLSVRSYNCLKRAGISTVEQLAGMSEEEMLKIRNLGNKSYEEIRGKIKGWSPARAQRRNLPEGRYAELSNQQATGTFIPGDQVIVHAEVLETPKGGSALYKLCGSDHISFYIKGKDLELDYKAE